MDRTALAIVIVVGTFAVIAIIGFIFFRQRGKMTMKAPFETELNLDLSNETQPVAPGVQMKGIKSRDGKVDVYEELDRGVRMEDVDAKHDIIVRAATKGPKA